MPKLKTRKSAKKRIKQTGTGKFRRFQGGKRHLMTGKRSSRKRRLSGSAEVNSADHKRVLSSLPYGAR